MISRDFKKCRYDNKYQQIYPTRYTVICQYIKTGVFYISHKKTCMYLCASLIKLDIVYVLSLQSVIISQPLFSAIEPQAATQQEIKFLLKYFKRVGMSSLYIYIIYTLRASVHDRMVLEKETCKLWYCFKTHKNYSNNLCSLNQSSNRKCLQIGGQ